MARMRGVARMAGGGRRAEWIARRDFVMMEETTGQLGMLLLLLTVMSGCSRGHVLVQHRRAHSTLGTTEGTRAVYTTDVTAATHTTADTARLVALLVFLVLHLRRFDIVDQFECSSTRFA